MVGEMFSCDNSGNRTGPHPDISDPVEGSAQNIICPIQNVDEPVTVIAGEMYAITCLVGPHIFGIAPIGAPVHLGNADGIWACGEGHTIVIRIPYGYTTLYCNTPDTTAFHRCILRLLAK